MLLFVNVGYTLSTNIRINSIHQEEKKKRSLFYQKRQCLAKITNESLQKEEQNREVNEKVILKYCCSRLHYFSKYVVNDFQDDAGQARIESTSTLDTVVVSGSESQVSQVSRSLLTHEVTPTIQRGRQISLNFVSSIDTCRRIVNHYEHGLIFSHFSRTKSLKCHGHQHPKWMKKEM